MDLSALGLNLIQCPALDKNPIYKMLKGKLVQFYQKFHDYQEDPINVKIDNLLLKRTLHDSLKHLLRTVITNEDSQIQLKQLMKVYNWYQGKTNALLSKEGIIAQKMREEQQQKKI